MTEYPNVNGLNYIFYLAKDNITNSWTAISSAISSSQELIYKNEKISSLEYEKFGKKMADMAADYSRSLSELAEGTGNAIERQALSEFSISISNAIDNLRTGGAEAYAKYGQDIIDATKAARLAKLAGMGGVLIDFAELLAASLTVRYSGDWRKFGEVSTGIGVAAAFGEFGAFLPGLIVGTSAFAASPLFVAATFLIAGSSALLGSFSGEYIFEGISGLVNSLFNQSRTFVFLDPLALDLDGDGIETIGVNPTRHVLFDHDGDGTRIATGWLKGDDGWLVLDRNGNGRIDNGSELFGVDTVLRDGRKASGGFTALSDLDSNHDRVFSIADTDYLRVQVWRDLDQDGISDDGELQSLAEIGIASISLDNSNGTLRLDGGNVQTAAGLYTRTDGSTGKVVNIDLVSNAFYREFSSNIPLTTEAARLPNLDGSGMVRDLQEAASLNPDLVRQVNAFNGMSRAEMMDKVDQLVADWAATADFKTSRERVEELGMKLICQLPGIGAHEMRALQLIGQPGYDKATVLSELMISVERYDTLRAQVTEMGRTIEILEAFNGQTYLSIPDDRLRIMAAGSGVSVESPTLAGFNSVGFDSTGTFMVFGESQARLAVPAEDIFVVVPLLRINQSGPLYQAFTLLKESVYDALVLQTRLKDYIDCIRIKIDAGGIAFDFTALDATLDRGYQLDPVQTFIDCLDLQKTDANLSRAGWAGAAKLAAWAGDLAMSGRLAELNSGLAAAFVTSSSGVPQINIGTASSNTILASGTEDLLLGLEGNDYIHGGDADDILDGGAGDDAMSGGSGSDVYLFGRGSGRDSIINYDTTIGKVDAIQFVTGVTSTQVQMIRSGQDLVLNLIGTNDRLNVSNYFYNDAGGPYQLEEIRFADGIIWNVSTVKRQVSQGTPASDSLYGYSVADTISGGDGNDKIEAYAGDDLLNGDNGDDQLYGGDGNDTLNGADGRDNLNGDRGDDILDGGAGNDLLSGGTGNDVYLFQRGSGNDTVNNYDYGTTKVDAIQFGPGVSSADVQIIRDRESLSLILRDGSDRVRVNGYFDNDAAGSGRLEELRFADGTIWNIETVKTMVQQGTSGNDTLYGYAVSDTIQGGDGKDDIRGMGGDDVLFGDSGADLLSGREGADFLYGGEGADNLSGDGGNDTLDGGAGNDWLTGGLGSDVYLFGRGSGSDRISNFDAGSGKTDAIQLGADMVGSDIQAIRLGDQLVLRLRGTADTLTVVDYFYRDSVSASKLEEIRFTDGTVWDVEAVKLMVLQGTAGNDTLYGYAVADTIYGSGGNDDIRGAAGDDLLVGGTGNDVFFTGAGDDLVLFNKGDGRDTFEHGGTGRDVLSLGGGISYADMAFAKAGDSLLLYLGAGDQILFSGWYAAFPSRPVAALQVIAEALPDYEKDSSNPLMDHKVECFNFSDLVAAFDLARAANAGFARWALIDALSQSRLSGSDTAALGGDAAYQYGLHGTVGLVGTGTFSDLLLHPAQGG